jgi:mRNA-degrading endonuclease toxin of MazEF toxin-antitoxin module
MSVQRGDIILANLPFSNMAAFKVRPGLVVQCDLNNQRLEDVIVAIITRTTKLAAIEPTQLLIDLQTPEGRATNLLHTSAVKCEHLITIEQRLILKMIGKLSATQIQKIDECLKISLEVP